MSHESPIAIPEQEVRPRGLQLLFMVLLITGMILIAIGFVSLVAETSHEPAPDACMALPQAGVFAPS